MYEKIRKIKNVKIRKIKNVKIRKIKNQTKIKKSLKIAKSKNADVTITELEEYGFNKKVIDSIKLITHDKETDYFDYVKNIKKNEIARKVKLADLNHNSNLSRLDSITKQDLERINKYKKAIEILES